MIIYLAKNTINSKVYIGKTKYELQYRKREHIHNSTSGSLLYFHRALHKYGPESFDWQVIDQAETEQKLNEKEKYWIQFYKSFDPQFGYNQTFGGDGGSKTDEVKRKLSNLQKGRHHTSVTKEKLRNINKGKKRGSFSDETKRKMSIAHKGKTFSVETREKMSLAKKGKPGYWLGKTRS